MQQMLKQPYQTLKLPYIVSFNKGCSVQVWYTQKQYDNAVNHAKKIKATIRRLGHHGN